ncbi:MAG: type II toxin-antitoxin system Phd/YefM family antitoxin [Acidobacteria bacterium]|nr:type II toxin-antitoxin system Phd/YefM family antitoxin [Acidobacteriota bacterium]
MVRDKVFLSEARRHLDQLVEQVRSEGHRILLENGGKPVAALVPPSDLRAIEWLEDWLDGQDALDVLADYRETGGVRWEDIKRDLGQ